MNATGSKALRSQQFLYKNLILLKRNLPAGLIIIHHVTDTPEKLQIEYEFIRYDGKIYFCRIVL